MYIYTIKFFSEKDRIFKNKHLLDFLPTKKIDFPENYIKIFLAEEKPEQIVKEHQLIYNGLKINMKFFDQKVLIQNFEKIKNFFEPHKNCPLLYYFKDFDKIDDIFEYFLTILTYCSSSQEQQKTISKNSSCYSIYSSLKNIIKEIQNKKVLYTSFTNINKHYNPCYKFFKEFSATKDYELLSNLYLNNNLISLSTKIEIEPETEEENIISLLHKLQQTNNIDWYKNMCSLEKMIQREENKNFNIVSFSNLETTILSFKDEDDQVLTYSEFSLKDPEEISNSELVIIFKELFSIQKRLEYDSVKIKLLEKGYFSEFEILSEFIIPKNDKIIHYLKEQIYDKDVSIEQIENLLINFNECIEANDQLIENITYQEYKDKDLIFHSDQKKLLNIRRIRVLKNYLNNYTQRKEYEKIAVSTLFEHFMQFLTIYYPGYNNYFHYRNFSLLMKELEYKNQRRNDGSFILNLEVKKNFL